MAHRRSVSRQFVVSVSLRLALFALVVGVILFAYEYNAEHRRAQNLQDQLVETVRVSASVALYANNQIIAEDVTNGLLLSQSILGVRIVSADIRNSSNSSEVPRGGDNTAGSGSTEKKSDFSYERSKSAEVQKVSKDSQGEKGVFTRYPLYSPLDNGVVIGYLIVEKNIAEINKRAFDGALLQTLLLILQIPVSAFLITKVFQRLVARPLATLADEIAAVSPGSSERLSISPGQEHNEIGRLIYSSNELLKATEDAILKEKDLQEELIQVELHYQRIFDATHVGVMILDANGRLNISNKALLTKILGHNASDATIQEKHNSIEAKDNFIEAIFEDPDYAWSMINEAHISGQIISGDLQLKGARVDERWVHCVFSVSLNDANEIEFIEGVLFDVTARRALESEARRAAEIDVLTGLVNRRGMEIFMDRSLRLARDKRMRLGVLLFDLDGFKRVNDLYKHASGDIVLQVLSERIAKRIRRSTDLVSRLGGDEFVILISDFENREALEHIAKDVIELVSRPVTVEGGVEVLLGASIGIACFPEDGKTRDELLLAADTVMYQVKRKGKNNFAFASDIS